MDFKEGFKWGVATASYQVEGGKEDRGLVNWDVFSAKPGAILDGYPGDIGCDHYNKMEEDVAIMKKMGIKAYRFSISWARLINVKENKINQVGYEFYNKLINLLIENDIEPFVTLYHWDLPYEYHLQGGWLNPKIVDWFADYTKTVVELFSDRVTNWITQNESQNFISLGYRIGIHAPGLKCADKDVFLGVLHALLAHGKAVQTIRKYAKKTPLVGIAPCGKVCFPRTESEEDIRAAREVTLNMSEKNPFGIVLFTDPIFFGRWPNGAKELIGDDLPEITEEMKEIITAPLDFLGFNHYRGFETYMDENGEPQFSKSSLGATISTMDWECTPRSIYWAFKFLYEQYKLPMYVTENGMACADMIAEDGKVYDQTRIIFLRKYLENLRRAINEGIDVRGYFLWSFIDNYEWQQGYRRRFGLVYVDYQNDCKRIIKESFKWYKKVIETNGEDLSEKY